LRGVYFTRERNGIMSKKTCMEGTCRSEERRNNRRLGLSLISEQKKDNPSLPQFEWGNKTHIEKGRLSKVLRDSNTEDQKSGENRLRPPKLSAIGGDSGKKKLKLGGEGQGIIQACLLEERGRIRTLALSALLTTTNGAGNAQKEVGDC